jgi:hypothetical protein
VIARIALDPSSLADLQVVDDEEATSALHDLLLMALTVHGAVVLGSPADAAGLVREVKAQSQHVRKCWEVVLSSLSSSRRLVRRTPPCTRPMSQIHRLEELCDEWHEQVEVVVVEWTRAEEFGVARSPGHIADAGSALEISTARAMRQTEAMDQARILAERANHPCGTVRDDFWSEVLAPLARLSNEAVVLDRYLFQRLLKGQAGRGSGGNEHVCWLLDCLDRNMPRGSRVTLIAHDEAPQDRRLPGPPPRVNASAIAALIERSWSNRAGGNLDLIEVVVAPWRQGRQLLPHDRHIRFNIGAAVTFTQGLDRLATRTIEEPDGLNWHYRQGTSAVQPLLAAEFRVLESRNGLSRATVLDRRAIPPPM